MMLNYTGCTVTSDSITSIVNSQPSGTTVLILDDDYFFKTTGVTEYLQTQLVSHVNGVGLIENDKIKILCIKEENFSEGNYSLVYKPSDIMDYFLNQKELNRNRFVPVG